MKYDLVIFDLDGTLLDTLNDLAAAANFALREAGFPVRSTQDIRRFIGNGAANMIRCAAPAGTPQERLDEMLARFKERYFAHANERTRPFEGIPELLRALRRAGIRAAVNSNKPAGPTALLCEAHFPGLMEMAVGENPDTPRKPAPDGALGIMRSLGIPPERTIYVGDGDADLLTAKNARIDCAWVSWGYRHRDELAGLEIPLAFDSAAELGSYLLS